MAAATFTATITMNADAMPTRNAEVGVIKSALLAIIQDFGGGVGKRTTGDAAIDIGIPGGHSASATWTYTTSLAA
jgi:hypothetical protein